MKPQLLCNDTSVKSNKKQKWREKGAKVLSSIVATVRILPLSNNNKKCFKQQKVSDANTAITRSSSSHTFDTLDQDPLLPSVARRDHMINSLQVMKRLPLRLFLACVPQNLLQAAAACIVCILYPQPVSCYRCKEKRKRKRNKSATIFCVVNKDRTLFEYVFSVIQQLNSADLHSWRCSGNPIHQAEQGGWARVV